VAALGRGRGPRARRRHAGRGPARADRQRAVRPRAAGEPTAGLPPVLGVVLGRGPAEEVLRSEVVAGRLPAPRPGAAARFLRGPAGSRPDPAIAPRGDPGRGAPP